MRIKFLLLLLTGLSVTNFGQSGWSSQTGYRNASTTVQRAIVRTATHAVGQSSGQSVTVSNGWLTDIAGGDGARMRKAISIYVAWLNSFPAFPAATVLNTSEVRSRMLAEFAGSGYDATRRNRLVDRIISVTNAKRLLVRLLVAPNNDNATLAYLGIRKQCLEWAMTTAIGAGGRSKNYHAAGLSDPRQARPGMGLYKNDRSHSMLILDIRWDAQGNPIEFKVAEANYAQGWMNPPGAPPWERKVTVRTGVRLSDHKIVDFER